MTLDRALPAWAMWIFFAALVSAGFALGYVEGAG